MNKTQRILACVGNVKYECIKNVARCTEQMVYTVLKSKNDLYLDYSPKHKGRVVPKKKKYDLKIEKGMLVTISESNLIWEVTFVGNDVVSVKNGYDKMNILKDKVKEIII